MLKRVFSIILCVCVISLLLVSCSSEDNKPELRYRIAYRVMDDGWVYVFANQYMEGDFDYGSHSETRSSFTFYGINLRYRYSQDYTEVIEIKDASGKTVTQTVPQSVLILGDSDGQAESGDLSKIADYLSYRRDGIYYTTEELLALTPSDLNFSYIDAELFLELMGECFAADPMPRGPYVSMPTWALFTEPEYVNDYKIQIGLIGGLGTVEMLMFDVLYRTGEGLTDYVQLHDLVRDGTATDEQVALLELLREIESGVTASQDLQWQHDTYGEKEVAGVSLARLYAMLKNIGANNYVNYLVMTY